MMYPFMNEDAAWHRIQDLQREMENSRLMSRNPQAAGNALARFAGRVRLLVGRAANRLPRRSQPA